MTCDLTNNEKKVLLALNELGSGELKDIADISDINGDAAMQSAWGR